MEYPLRFVLPPEGFVRSRDKVIKIQITAAHILPPSYK